MQKIVCDRSPFTVERLGQSVVEFLWAEIAPADPGQCDKNSLFFGRQGANRDPKGVRRRIFFRRQRAAAGVASTEVV